MKAKSLLVIGAILALVIAVGCSNTSRTTAPVNTTESFNMPNSGDINRFDNDQSTPVIQGNNPDWSTLTGVFNRDKNGCISLRVEKETYIELAFVRSVPADTPNGAKVKVKGYYNMLPGGHCQLQKSFSVTDLSLYDDTNGTPR
jgi:hypothetical protein